MINSIAIMETPFLGLTADGLNTNSYLYAYHGSDTYKIVRQDAPSQLPVAVFSFERQTAMVGLTMDTAEPNLIEEIKQLAGIFSVINCSIGSNNAVNDYNFDATEMGRVCFNKGTECVWSAGNWDGQIGKGPNFDDGYIWYTWIDKTIASPYLLVAGAVTWAGTYKGAGTTPVVNGQYSLDPFEVADYSMANPRFVTFMLDGYTLPAANPASANGYSGSSGTSFAAPRLSAFVAQIETAHPEYNMSQIMTTLMNNETPFVSTKKNDWIEEVILGDKLTTTSETINTSILVENAYEVFLGRHATPTELSSMVANLNKGNQTTTQALTWFETNSNYTQQLCPLQQQVEGLYHMFMNRDGSDKEIDACLQYYANEDHENWAKFCNDWTQYYKIGLPNNYHFGV
jgi:hypothetical protein